MLSVTSWHADRPFSKPITETMHVHHLTLATNNRVFRLRPNQLRLFQLGVRHTLECFGVTDQLSSKLADADLSQLHFISKRFQSLDNTCVRHSSALSD